MMIEFLIVLLAIGFCIYYTFRHPAKTFKVVGGALGLLTLGILGCVLFVLLAFAVLSML